MSASLLGMLAYSWIRKRPTVPRMVKLIEGFMSGPQHTGIAAYHTSTALQLFGS